jgi:hypothetical protein
MNKLNSAHTECALLILAKLIEKSFQMLGDVTTAKRDQLIAALEQVPSLTLLSYLVLILSSSCR